ncbi:putative FAD synthase [Helianthus annuus]|nr:putative FAD synthase [Helianthus annuus]
MEIDEAIRDCDDRRRLKIKYKNAIYVIQRALQLYSIEEVAFSFNGGKDSTVLLHLLRAGYFLHQVEHGHSNESLSDGRFTFPIHTIYCETPSVFPEINSFTYETAARSTTIQLWRADIIREDFKSGLEALLKAKPTRAIFLGVRIGDPTAVGQEQFSPSSPGWPAFMRVNPILDWSYRCGRLGFPFDVHGSVLRSLRSRVDSVAEEVERLKSMSDLVFIYGGVGPLHSDVTVGGVAKAFGVRLEEYLSHVFGDKCTGDRNEMAQLPEGITELLQHEKLRVPLLEVAQPLSKISFPDIYTGCYRKSRSGPLVTTLEGKDQETVETAMEALSKKLSSGVKRISA